MSGEWHDGKWYRYTGYICRRCGAPVFKSNLRKQGYKFQCFECDEDMFGFEVMKADSGKGGSRICVLREKVMAVFSRTRR